MSVEVSVVFSGVEECKDPGLWAT